jgi:hypothetical protein
MTKPAIEKITWEDCKEDFRKVARDLYDRIEAINPGKEFYLYRVKYQYGDQVVGDEGCFQLPTKDGGLIRIDDESLPKYLREDLRYQLNALPLSLATRGRFDIYQLGEGRAIKLQKIYKAGIVLAARQALDSPKTFQSRSLWRVTAGARQAFFVANISNTGKFEKLRNKYSLSCAKPNSQDDHFNLFKELAHHPSFKTKWHAELILFPKKWLTEIKKKKEDKWSLLYLSLLERTWKISSYERNVSEVNNLWSVYVRSLRNKHIDDYVTAVTRHVIEASLGEAPLFKTYSTDTHSGPFKEIIEIIVNDYGLNKFTPILVYADHFSLNEKETGYISLKHLSRPLPFHANFENRSLLQATDLIQYAFNLFKEKMRSQELRLEDTLFSELLKLEHKFFYLKNDHLKKLKLEPNSKLFSCDKNVNKLQKKYPRSQIPISSKNSFVISCVSINALAG